MDTVLVRNADRMMTSARPMNEGIEVLFADGCGGLIPFVDIPEVAALSNIESIELPNPYEIVIHSIEGGTVELPWDFARHYCDPAYQPRVEAIALSGRQAIGARIRRLRESAGLTQERLAQQAGIGRATLVRLEKGEYSPRYETLVSLARALGKPAEQLLV